MTTPFSGTAPQHTTPWSSTQKRSQTHKSVLKLSRTGPKAISAKRWPSKPWIDSTRLSKSTRSVSRKIHPTLSASSSSSVLRKLRQCKWWIRWEAWVAWAEWVVCLEEEAVWEEWEARWETVIKTPLDLRLLLVWRQILSLLPTSKTFSSKTCLTYAWPILRCWCRRCSMILDLLKFLASWPASTLALCVIKNVRTMKKKKRVLPSAKKNKKSVQQRKKRPEKPLKKLPCPQKSAPNLNKYELQKPKNFKETTPTRLRTSLLQSVSTPRPLLWTPRNLRIIPTWPQSTSK